MHSCLTPAPAKEVGRQGGFLASSEGLESRSDGSEERQREAGGGRRRKMLCHRIQYHPPHGRKHVRGSEAEEIRTRPGDRHRLDDLPISILYISVASQLLPTSSLTPTWTLRLPLDNPVQGNPLRRGG